MKPPHCGTWVSGSALHVQMTINNCKAVLLDIEGTTTSISFVKETLFPFVRQELRRFLRDNWSTPELNEVITGLIDQNERDIRDGLANRPVAVFNPPAGVDEIQASVVTNVLWQMDNDRKTGALKRLQGLMFREAYEQGHLKGHVYDDVPPALKFWIKSGKRIYIYSSGSVEAQKLLFEYSTHGNLCSYISGYFDTTVGPKVVSTSYTRISNEMNLPPEAILFVTDIAREAVAAREAGLKVRLSVRQGNYDLAADDVMAFGTVNSFDELSYQ